MEAERRAEQPRPDAGRGYLFDRVTCVNAPSLVVSAPGGDIGRRPVEAWLCADRRYLSTLVVSVDGVRPVGLGTDSPSADVVVFRGVLPGSGEAIEPPTLFVDRRRELGHHELVETVILSSGSVRPRDVTLQVRTLADFAPMAEVRMGRERRPVVPEATAEGLRWSAGADAVDLACTPVPEAVDVGRGVLCWTTTLRPREAWSLVLRFRAEPAGVPPFVGVDVAPWRPLEVTCPDERVSRLLRQGLADLEGLLLGDPTDGGTDPFVAAGSPWFLTLFGRDSLWTARMMLPLGTDLAMSTLRVLARRQGRRVDPASDEEPGRIPHEVRGEPLDLGSLRLPPTYYGTVDATPLFVISWAEAWRWGAEPAAVEALVPAVEGCLRWLEEQSREDGFVRYVDTTGHRLGNQGWKDSPDSIQRADGTPAEPPIALSEAQAYAYQAAVLGAELLARFGRPGADRWRGWARALADRFRESFWVEDDRGPFPAVALDARGRPADSVASNMGHLLGTGLLAPDESALVAARIMAADLDSGFGLRTLSARSPRFSPLSYHGGAVWPHDTAIAVAGLAQEGFHDAAAVLFRGLLRAAPGFGYRLPELYGGDDARQVQAPRPYPTACRPQAWAAAAPIAGLAALLGLGVTSEGRLTAAPALPRSLLPLHVDGLRTGRRRWALTVDEHGGWSAEVVG